MPLMQQLLRVLAQQAPDGQTVLYKPLPTPQMMDRIKPLAMAYEDAGMGIGSVVHDFRIEIQNVLLGDLFGRKIPKRQPLDPREIVVSTEPEEIARLEKYFDEKTAWGRMKRETEERVRQTLAANNGRGENGV